MEAILQSQEDEPMKVVINKCYGGFGISQECLKLYNKLSGKNEKYDFGLERHDPNLIKAIEELGIEKARDGLAKLKIVEIPDGKEYDIEEYDGFEHIHEKVEIWG